MTGAVFDPGAQQAIRTLPLGAVTERCVIYPCMEQSRVVSPTPHREQNRPGSQIPTGRTDGLARGLASPQRGTERRPAGGPPGADAAIVRPRHAPGGLTSPATSASNWTSALTEPVNVVQVVVGPTGSVAAPEQAIVDYIRSTFVDHPKPDLIVTVAGPAAVFARKYRQQLFPDTPILFASVDRRFLDDAPLGDNETAVAVDNQFSRHHRDHSPTAARDQAGVHGDGVRARSAGSGVVSSRASSVDFTTG